jgi:Bacterial SH3 domain
MMRQKLKGRAFRVRAKIGPIVGLVLTSLTLAPPAFGRQVVVQSASPFRSGPNQRFASMGSVPAGTVAEAIGQDRGWIQLKLDDGRTGYVFQNNVRDVPEPTPVPGETPSTTTTTPPAETSAATPTTTPPANTPIPDDLPSLKTELSTLREKVDSLNAALARERGAAGGLVERAPRDGSVSLTIAALLTGLFFGFLFSRLFQRRSDRRQWNKLRL